MLQADVADLERQKSRSIQGDPRRPHGSVISKPGKPFNALGLDPELFRPKARNADGIDRKQRAAAGAAAPATVASRILRARAGSQRLRGRGSSFAADGKVPRSVISSRLNLIFSCLGNSSLHTMFRFDASTWTNPRPTIYACVPCNLNKGTEMAELAIGQAAPEFQLPRDGGDCPARRPSRQNRGAVLLSEGRHDGLHRRGN